MRLLSVPLNLNLVAEIKGDLSAVLLSMRLRETILLSMRLPVHIWIREENATPEELAGYFTELARRFDAHPQKMRLMIESSVPAVLDFDPADGEPVVSVGGRTHKFSLRHRWLPEHPVPLLLGSVPNAVPASVESVPMPPAGSVPTTSQAPAIVRHIFPQRRLTLLIDPVDGNRFRVRSCRPIRAPRSAYALFAVAAVAAAVTLHPLAIALSAFLLAGLVGWLALSAFAEMPRRVRDS